MLYRLLGLLACTLVLTSCALAYRNFPDVGLDGTSLPKREFPIYYHIDKNTPFRFGFQYYHLAYSALEQAFEQDQTFSEAVGAAFPPKQGLYCSATVRIEKNAEFLLPILFPLLLPGFEIQSNMVGYSLYLDGVESKTYEYSFERIIIWWGLGAPLIVWGNLFTNSLEDAIGATFYQFLRDAERDGHLAPP